MKKEMLINTVEGQECRIAIVCDGVLDELYVERASSASRVGNIYKGRVTNVEPSIQAAFIDFGLTKNGFLHISDVSPKYFPKRDRETESVGRRRSRRDRPPIQECLRRGQEVVVQMTKEGIGTKGPTMTTYLSIPGRLLVMMPGMSRLGVSRKIEDDDARGKARSALSELKLPDDMGFIVRTAGIGQSKRELQRDLNYLLRLWKAVSQRIQGAKAPSEIYQESDLVIRTIRDVYNSDIGRIVCDNAVVGKQVAEFLDMAMPRTKCNVEFYKGATGLFYECGLESEIERIHARHVQLPSGGSIVIDQTEALVAIDVNSGRSRQHADAETTALKTNLEATEEIVRQLRLRDMGGVIVIDFIDMYQDKNRRAVERELRGALKNDRAKTKLGRVSSFGIVEMTRQRVRPSLEKAMYRPCTHCEGAGMVKSDESLALLVMRALQRAAAGNDVAQIEVSVAPSVANHLSNVERGRIYDLETLSGKRIIVRSNPDLGANDVKFACTNGRGTGVACEAGTTPDHVHLGTLKTVPIDQVKTPPPAAAQPAPTEKPSAAGEPAQAAADSGKSQPSPSKKRRRRRKKKPSGDSDTGDAGKEQREKNDGEKTEPKSDKTSESSSDSSGGEQSPADGEAPPKKKRRRRGGRKHKRRSKKPSASGDDSPGQSGSSSGDSPSPGQNGQQ